MTVLNLRIQGTSGVWTGMTTGLEGVKMRSFGVSPPAGRFDVNATAAPFASKQFVSWIEVSPR
jgi:hypothetical protein